MRRSGSRAARSGRAFKISAQLFGLGAAIFSKGVAEHVCGEEKDTERLDYSGSNKGWPVLMGLGFRQSNVPPML